MSLIKEITNLQPYKDERNRILSPILAANPTNFSDLLTSSRDALRCRQASSNQFFKQMHLNRLSFNETVNFSQYGFYSPTSMTMSGYLCKKPLLQPQILASLYGTIGTLHTPPNPFNFSAKITKQTERVHAL